MLTLTAPVEDVVTIPSRTDKKTGEIYPARHVVQLKTKDRQGRSTFVNLTVADPGPYKALVGKTATFPVDAFVIAGQLHFALGSKQPAAT